MLIVGRRLIPWILHYVAHTGSRELFRLAVLAIALGVAFGARQAVRRVAGARRLLRRHDAERDPSSASAPRRRRCRCATPSRCCSSSRSACCSIRSALVEKPWPIAGDACSSSWSASRVAAFLIVDRLPPSDRHGADDLGEPGRRSAKFSFILADLGVGLEPAAEGGPRPDPGRRDLLDRAQPADLRGVDRLKPWLRRAQRSRAAGCRRGAAAPGRMAPVTAPGHAASRTVPADGKPAPPTKLHATILVGYGRVGSLVGAALQAAQRPAVPGDRGRRQDGRQASSSSGVEDRHRQRRPRRGVCRGQSGRRAGGLISPFPTPSRAGQIVQRAARRTPGIDIIARAHSDAEVDHLKGLGANTVIMGEREIARGIVEEVLERQAEAASTG